jgi:hypothetical protein
MDDASDCSSITFWPVPPSCFRRHPCVSTVVALKDIIGWTDCSCNKVSYLEHGIHLLILGSREQFITGLDVSVHKSGTMYEAKTICDVFEGVPEEQLGSFVHGSVDVIC